MKKVILAIFVMVFLYSVPADAANKMWWATGRTGGGDSLDGIDGADVTAGDGAIVVTDLGATTPLIEFYRAYESGVAESDPNVISPNTNAGTKRWHRIPSVPAGDSFLTISVSGALSYNLAADYEPAGAAAASVPIATITQSGDLIVGTGAGAVTRLGKGSNNTLLGVNNAGTLGYISTINLVWAEDPTDDTYTGIVTTITAGEAIAQWELVYVKNDGGSPKAYKYDVDETTANEMDYPALYLATAAVDSAASGNFLVMGTVHNETWAMTNNQDEGYLVCASTTAGALAFVAPGTGCTVPVGHVINDDRIMFRPSLFGAGTGTGKRVNATSPTLVTPELGAATASSLAATGIVSGKVGVTSVADNYTLGTVPAELKGYLILFTAGAKTLTLPDMVVGESFCAMTRDDNEALIIDAHANDSITLCPTAATCVKGVAGATITNTVAAADGAGNYICFLVVEADNVMQMGGRGIWVVP